MPAALAPHRLPPRPWRALTDLEWAELRVWLPHGDPELGVHPVPITPTAGLHDSVPLQ